VDPVPYPLLLRRSGSAGNRTWDLNEDVCAGLFDVKRIQFSILPGLELRTLGSAIRIQSLHRISAGNWAPMPAPSAPIGHECPRLPGWTEDLPVATPRDGVTSQIMTSCIDDALERNQWLRVGGTFCVTCSV
jgi:hypothetical protein